MGGLLFPVPLDVLHIVSGFTILQLSIENELWKSPHSEVKLGIIHLVRFHVNLTELQNEVRLYLNLARFARIVVNTD